MTPDSVTSADSPPPLSLPDAPVGRGIPAGLRKTLFYALAGILSSAIGISLVHFPEKLVFAAVIAVSSAILILVHPFSGLLLYSANIFLRPAEIWPVMGPLHLERIIGVLTLASIALSNWYREGHLTIDWSRQTRWLGLFWLSTFFSMPTSYWPTKSAEMITEVLKIIAFYVMIVSLVNTKRRLAAFMWLYLGMIVYFAVGALNNYYSGNFAFAQGIERAVGETSYTDNANQLGSAMACTIPLLLLLMGKVGGFWKRGALATSIVLCIWTLALTGSRSGALSLVGGIGFLWWTSRRRVGYGILLVVLFLAGFMLLPDQYKQRYETIGHGDLDASSRSRLNSWTAGLQMFMNRPLFGVGIGTFGIGNSEITGSWLGAHSLYVQVPSELGLFGLITFFGFLFASLKTNAQARRRIAGDTAWSLERTYLNGILTGFLALAIAGIFGHNMLRPQWYVFAAIGQVVYRMSTQDHQTGDERVRLPA